MGSIEWIAEKDERGRAEVADNGSAKQLARYNDASLRQAKAVGKGTFYAATGQFIRAAGSLKEACDASSERHDVLAEVRQEKD